MKTCDVKDCNDPVFGTDRNTKKRFCKRHQFLRTDIVKSIKKKSVKERNEAMEHNKLDFDTTQWGFSSEEELFMWIWENSPHRSEVSGKNLDKVKLFWSMFAHVLPKGKYPLFRYNPENIILVNPLEHVLIDQGSSSARRKYEKENPGSDFSVFYRKKEELLSKYPKQRKIKHEPA